MLVLPLYVKFAGSVCRYLRRWLDAEDEVVAVPTSSTTVKVAFDSKSTVTSSVTYESDRWKRIAKTTLATIASTTESTSSVAAEKPKSSCSFLVGVAAVGRGEGSDETPGSSDEDDDNWKTKFVRNLSTAGDMDIYKLDKDGSYRKLKSDLLLDQPHPDQRFEDMWETRQTTQSEELVVDGVKDSKDKRHACANCRKVEASPKQFKKCQR